MKKTYIIWTTKTTSYIAPLGSVKLPKHFTNSYEIDTELELCEKKTNLNERITSMEQLAHHLTLLNNLKKQNTLKKS